MPGKLPEPQSDDDGRLSASKGFAAVARPDARALVLGSLPGQASLAHGEYYAQQRNAFWPIMGRLAGASPDLPYAERLRRLIEKRVALWDVCAEGRRPGSLDQRIDPASVVTNDFATFLSAHPHIQLICFNGATAGRLFRHRVAPELPARLETTVLPSTSPAHAAMPFERKLECWREALSWLL